MTRYFQSPVLRQPKFLEPDSTRFTQTTLQAQASAAVAEREYRGRYPLTEKSNEDRYL